MSTGAWIMLVFGCVVLYGGLAWSIGIALKKRPLTTEPTEEKSTGDA